MGEVAAAPIGPGSILWQVAGDPRSLLPGTAAGIMQLMLPGLDAGVTDHSNFFDDPFDRIFRSIPPIWRSIFSDDDECAEVGRTIRRFHDHVKGTDEQGRRYHALDPDVFWWAHATFTWEFLRARELYFPVPLRRAEREQLYAETVTWYRRYGVSDRPVPPTLDAFRARFDEICRNQLELTPAVQWVLDPSANPSAPSAPTSRDRCRCSTGWPPTSGRRRSGCWSTARCPTSSGAGSASGGPTATGWPFSSCAPRCASGPLVAGQARRPVARGHPHLDPQGSGMVVIAGPSRRQRADAGRST
ncbi:MAG: oxygenase MpaB family protein [Acidimicrobiales bacterium]